MPSREVRSYSLRLRVALSTAITATCVGLVSAAVATWLVARLDQGAQDQRLRDIALVLEADLDHDAAPLEESVEDEAKEVAPLGVRLALFRDGARVAGALEAMDSNEGCATSTSTGGVAWRACAFGPAERRIVVTAPETGFTSSGVIALVAITVSSLFAAIAGALASHFLAKWALSPLSVLTLRLGRVTSAAPAAADLGDTSRATEVEALRETLRSLFRRLGDALTQSRTFASAAAHELRTPLALMTTELELAAERTPQIAPELERVRRTLYRLTRLVERLLALASDQSPLSDVREAVALEDVVRDVVGTEPEAERSRIATAVEAPGMVRGDEALLRLVVENLLENALKFAPQGPIHVAVDERPGAATLIVIDEGPGIAPDEWAKLLQPFVRGNQALPGHGLGLAITAHVVRLHGGTLSLLPSSRGTAIEVRLPAWTGTEDPTTSGGAGALSPETDLSRA